MTAVEQLGWIAAGLRFLTCSWSLCILAIMTGLTRTLLAVVLAASALFPGSSRALTIYRIGGEGMAPPPEAGLDGVDFVPRRWEEAGRGFDGRVHGLTAAEGSIAPLLISPDENLMLGAIARGGGPVSFTIRADAYFRIELMDAMIDGDPSTAFRLIDAGKGLERYPADSVSRFVFDLGARFPINRMRLYPEPRLPDRYVEDFAVTAVDGGERFFTQPWKLVGHNVLWSVKVNRDQVADFSFPTRNVANLLLTVQSPQAWEIAEFEVYGEGYVPEAVYRTAVLDLEAPATLGPLRWTGFRDRDARVMIHTRSGTDEDPHRYWRFSGRGDERTYLDEQGQPLTRASYESLAGGRAEITADLDNWSAWSGVYDFADSAGTAVVSSSPRQFLQVQVEFLPEGKHGGGLDVLEFRTTQPPVSGPVVGEVWPVQTAPGEVTWFVCALRPELGVEAGGFDRIVLETSGSFAGVDSVRINHESVTSDPIRVEDTRLEIGIPRMDRSMSGRLIEVFFRAQVYYYGTVFQGQVFDSERPLEVGQLVQAGDATFRFDSSQLWVAIQLGGRLLHDVAVRPPIISPNGDGVNDRVAIEYSVLKLAGTGMVQVEIFDLSGQRVRQIHRGRDCSGRHVQEWDGRGEDGRVVSPGLYLYRVRVDPDESREERRGIIPVAY